METIDSNIVAFINSLSGDINEILSTVMNKDTVISTQSEAIDKLNVQTVYEFYKYAAAFEDTSLLTSDMV